MPSASTASRPSTSERIEPWRSTWVPPALVDTSPPTVAEPLPPSVSGKRRPAAAAASCRVSRIVPAPQVTCRASVLTGSIVLSRRSDSSTAAPLSSGVAPPHMPLLPPCGTIGTPWAAQIRTTSATSAVEPGETRARARPVKRPRQSVSQGSMRSGSVVRPRGPSRSARAVRTASVGTVMAADMAQLAARSQPFAGLPGEGR